MRLVVLAAALSLHQQLNIGADQLGVFLSLNGVLQRDESLEAFLHDLLGDLVVHLCRGSAWARRVLERKCGGEAGAAHHIQGGLEVLLRLPRESHNDVGGDRRMRHLFAHLVEDAEELLRAVGAAHVLEYLVRA